MAINPQVLQQRALGLSFPIVPQVKVIYTDATGTTIAGGTTYTIAWNAALYDTQGMFDPSDPTRITFRQAGLAIFDVFVPLNGGTFSATTAVGHLRLSGNANREPLIYAPGTAANEWAVYGAAHRVEPNDYAQILIQNQDVSDYGLNGTNLWKQPRWGCYLLPFSEGLYA